MKTQTAYLSLFTAGLVATGAFLYAESAAPRATAAVADNAVPANRTPVVGALPGFFAMLDTDDDGLLSAKEIAAASEVLKKLDKNGDGQLTLREVSAAVPQRGPGMGARGGNMQGAGSRATEPADVGPQPQNNPPPRASGGYQGQGGGGPQGGYGGPGMGSARGGPGAGGRRGGNAGGF